MTRPPGARQATPAGPRRSTRPGSAPEWRPASTTTTPLTIVALASNGDIAITVPAGALSAPTRIGVSESAAQDPGDGVPVTSRFTFTPDGATFAVPVRVTLRYAVPVSHFQVSAGVERAIELRCFDAATGTWVSVPTTLDTASDTLSASISHFSEWEGAAIQPHGTSGDKTGYCSGICHDLIAAPGSSTLIAPSDPAVCYNCHGSTATPAPSTWFAPR